MQQLFDVKCVCRYIRISRDEIVHSKECEHFQEGGQDAEDLGSKLKDLRLGDWADTVLEIHPKHAMVSKPEVLGTDKDGVVVLWKYPHFDLKLARASVVDGKFGTITVYAVQEIIPHDERRNKTIIRKYRSSSKPAKNKHS